MESGTTPGNFSPQPSDMEDPAFAATALAEFNETPARGPYTIAGSSTAIFLPLANITGDYQSIADSIRAMVADGSAASYLPADYRADPAMIRGYEKQLSVLADLSENPDAPSMETPFATGTSIHAISLHPLSRGTVRLNTGSPLSQPIIDYRTGSNPVDFDIYLAHIKFLRRLFNTTTMQQFGAVEVTPGAGAQSDEAVVDYIKDDLTFSFMHPCCTSAMMPADDGGVVGTDLRVHGAAGLRVVDMGVLPILPSAHLSATAYAVGEKVSTVPSRRAAAAHRSQHHARLGQVVLINSTPRRPPISSSESGQCPCRVCREICFDDGDGNDDNNNDEIKENPKRQRYRKRFIFLSKKNFFLPLFFLGIFR